MDLSLDFCITRRNSSTSIRIGESTDFDTLDFDAVGEDLAASFCLEKGSDLCTFSSDFYHGNFHSSQINLPIATAVSIIRLEKPHSLSYHDITRTSVPSITLVWSMANTDECASWLKSLETLGASV
jgi:hypothetical protein